MDGLQPNSSKKMPPNWPVGLAVVLGLLIGLIPKSSAACYVVALAGLLLPVSLPTMAVSAVVFSLVGPNLDSVTDAVGYWLLTHPWLFSVWQSMESLPGFDWFRLNNSVVVGSLAVAGMFAVPVYFSSIWGFRQVHLWTASRASNHAPAGQTFATELE
jgi:uncharacterized protein (TIGR03546 family)